MEKLPQTHIGLTRRSWRRVRDGLSRISKSSEDRKRCLEWCLRFPDHTQIWTEILRGGHREMTAAALGTEDFFDLRPDVMAWWERIIQNHPFAAIFAGERYAALLRKRMEKGEQTCF